MAKPKRGKPEIDQLFDAGFKIMCIFLDNYRMRDNLSEERLLRWNIHCHKATKYLPEHIQHRIDQKG